MVMVMVKAMVVVKAMVKTNNENGNGDDVPGVPLTDPPSFFGYVSERED